MSTNHVPSDSESSNDGWELVGKDSQNSDDGVSSSGSDFVRLEDVAVSFHHRLHEANIDSNQDFETFAKASFDEEDEYSESAHVPGPVETVGAESDVGLHECTRGCSSADLVGESSDEERLHYTHKAKSVDAVEEEPMVNAHLNDVGDDLLNDDVMPQGVDEVYAVLRERLSARMSRESSSESDSDFIRLESSAPSSLRSRDSVMRASGSSISSRFSFIQHTDGDEDESLPESDISLLTEPPAREDSVMVMRPTNHPHYRHYTNSSLNFWLNVAVGVVLALAIGLGIGHAIGSSREIRNQRDIQLVQVDRIKTLQDDLVSCIKRAEDSVIQQARTEKNEFMGVAEGLRTRAEYLEWHSRLLSESLAEKSVLVDDLVREKQALLSEIDGLKRVLSDHSDKLKKMSGDQSETDSRHQLEIEDVLTRIDQLETKSGSFEKLLPVDDFNKLRSEVTNLRNENDDLRREVAELRDAKADIGHLIARIQDLETRNAALEKKNEEAASTLTDKIQEEIEKLRKELNVERTISHLWTSLLAVKNSSLPYMYEQFRAVVNASQQLPAEVLENVHRLSNSTLVKDFWQKALNSTEWAKNFDWESLPELAVNRTRDMISRLKSSINHTPQSTEEMDSDYLGKTKKTITKIGDQIRETWSKLKTLSVSKEDVKEKAEKIAKKFTDNVEGFGERIKLGIKRFSDKINKFKATHHKEHERSKETQYNSNSYSFGENDKEQWRNSYKMKHEKRNFHWEKKLESKFTHFKRRIDKMHSKSWSRMEEDDIEDILEDIRELLMYFNSPWLDCQKNWWNFQYTGDEATFASCRTNLFQWQIDLLKPNSFTDSDTKRNSTSSTIRGDWYFKSRDRGVDSDWYQRRAELREESRERHDTTWVFDRARQRDLDRRSCPKKSQKPKLTRVEVNLNDLNEKMARRFDNEEVWDNWA